tara:strand:+ start:967 stop:1266 length:300 start_codon:yes stop_codon:yes gene_type:complete
LVLLEVIKTNSINTLIDKIVKRIDTLIPIKKLIKVHSDINEAYALCLKYNLYFPTSSVLGLFFKFIEDMILLIDGDIFSHKLIITISCRSMKINRLVVE